MQRKRRPGPGVTEATALQWYNRATSRNPATIATVLDDLPWIVIGDQTTMQLDALQGEFAEYDCANIQLHVRCLIVAMMVSLLTEAQPLQEFHLSPTVHLLPAVKLAGQRFGSARGACKRSRWVSWNGPPPECKERYGEVIRIVEHLVTHDNGITAAIAAIVRVFDDPAHDIGIDDDDWPPEFPLLDAAQSRIGLVPLSRIKCRYPSV